MQLIRGLHNWRRGFGPSVATIGNFDGVHLGHQALLDELCGIADKLGLPSTVITFEPLPQEFFDAEARLRRVQTFRDRIDSIAACGIDQTLMIPFNAAFSAQPAEQFVKETLQQKLAIRHLLIGDDFRFGKARGGDFTLLQALQLPGRFEVSAADTFSIDRERVSSSRIRELMGHRDCAGIAALLGRPYRITGRVVAGAQIGRQLGFPTANVALKRHRPLMRGVFAVDAIDAQGKRWPSVANLGERPTVDGQKLLLEVHLLEGQHDLYGSLLQIDFHQHLRDEQKFASLDALKAAIAEDCAQARRFFQQQ